MREWFFRPGDALDLSARRAWMPAAASGFRAANLRFHHRPCNSNPLPQSPVRLPPTLLYPRSFGRTVSVSNTPSRPAFSIFGGTDSQLHRCCPNGSWPGGCPRLLPATPSSPAHPSLKSRLFELLKLRIPFRYGVYLTIPATFRMGHDSVLTT